MPNLQTTADIRADVLSRGNEIASTASEYWQDILAWMNRQYYSLCLGGTTFAPEIREDWFWLRALPPGILIMDSPITIGTVTASTDSASITFSSAPTASIAGWEFRPTGDDAVYRVSIHTGGQADATLDSIYVGLTGSGKSYTLRKVEYALSPSVLRPVQALRALQWNDSDSGRDIFLTDMVSLERDYPRGEMLTGVPDCYALIAQGSMVSGGINYPTVRLNRGGLPTGKLRVEYEYLRRPPLLTALDPTEEPLVPHEWRGVLADMTLYYLLLQKEDSRVDAIGLAAKVGIRAMAREQRRLLATQSPRSGQIRPRASQQRRWGTSRLWRT
jgi:hypothetical protein